MSTNAAAIIYDEYKDEPICAIYKHWDGYPDGFGEQLRSFAKSRKIVNGLSLDEQEPVANGMGCFAAQLVATLKEKPGDVYMTPLDGAESHEYVYRLRFEGVMEQDGHVKVTCDQAPEWNAGRGGN